MTPEEQKVFTETRLRNLKRRYSKLTNHSDLTDEALTVKKEIESLEAQLP